MQVKCSNCGAEIDEYWAEAVNTGRKTIYLCWECYKAGQKEATVSDIFRKKRLSHISSGKKINK